MAVNNNWRPTVTFNDWMRDIEKRLMHEERRPIPLPAEDVVGPGFRPYAVVVQDWNSDAPIVGGHYYSDANQVVNSPDDTKNWMGIVQSTPYGEGLQRVWEYVTTTEEPSPDPALYTRAFHTHEDGAREYTDWVQSGAGGGAPTGPAGGDLAGTYPDPQIATGAVGSAEIADGSVTNNDLAATGTKDSTTFLRGDGTWAVPPSGGGGVSDGNKGDITVSGGGANWQINSGAVGSAEIADGSVGNLELGTNAVTPDKIADLPATPANTGDPTSKTYVDTQVTAATTGKADKTTTMTAGAGLAGGGDLSANRTFDVGAGAGIQVNADTVQVANNGITNAMIADGAVNLASADVTGTLPISKGGTGATSAPAARAALGAVGKYANTIGAMTAGVEITVTHALGTTDVDATFRIAASDLPIELDWRPFDIDTIRVKADVAFAANAIRAVVMG